MLYKIYLVKFDVWLKEPQKGRERGKKNVKLSFFIYFPIILDIPPIDLIGSMRQFTISDKTPIHPGITPQIPIHPGRTPQKNVPTVGSMRHPTAKASNTSPIIPNAPALKSPQQGKGKQQCRMS